MDSDEAAMTALDAAVRDELAEAGERGALAALETAVKEMQRAMDRVLEKIAAVREALGLRQRVAEVVERHELEMTSQPVRVFFGGDGRDTWFGAAEPPRLGQGGGGMALTDEQIKPIRGSKPKRGRPRKKAIEAEVVEAMVQVGLGRVPKFTDKR